MFQVTNHIISDKIDKKNWVEKRPKLRFFSHLQPATTKTTTKTHTPTKQQKLG